MLSISQNVRLSVCLSVRLCVCLFTFEVPFNGLFAPTSQSRMSNIFRIRNPWGKVMERSGLTFELFCLELVYNRHAKIFFFVADFALQNMVEATLPDGLETSGRRAYR